MSRMPCISGRWVASYWVEIRLFEAMMSEGAASNAEERLALNNTLGH
jgi:hypothetical protein